MSDSPYPPPPEIAARAFVGSLAEYQRMYLQSIEDPETFWAEQAKKLDFFRPFDRVLYENFEQADFRWFEGAELNVAYNCIDRHLPARAAQTAIIWAGDQQSYSEAVRCCYVKV